eukprot:COSAG02_NODE_164_length_32230_cov_37.505587_2_plen_103_part_00
MVQTGSQLRHQSFAQSSIIIELTGRSNYAGKRLKCSVLITEPAPGMHIHASAKTPVYNHADLLRAQQPGCHTHTGATRVMPPLAGRCLRLVATAAAAADACH